MFLSRVVGQFLATGDGHVPDGGAGKDLAVPEILPDHHQHVPAVEVRALVDVGLGALEREALHRGVEIDESEGDKDAGADRQPDFLTGALDQLRWRRRYRADPEDIIVIEPISLSCGLLIRSWSRPASS